MDSAIGCGSGALVDPEVVGRRLREIGRRVSALRELRAESAEAFLRDVALQTQAERHLQLALQSTIDIALHIVAEDTDRTPEDYGSAFLLLAERHIIPADLAGRLRLSAGLRNLLVHAYLDIDPARVWAHLERLDDLEAFAVAAQDYLDRAP